MRWCFIVFAAATAWAQSAAEVNFASEGIVNAPVEEVWKVFSTGEGYKKLGTALADVDLRIGGLIRSRYSADGQLGDAQTIENRILAFEPPSMIAIQIHKPPQGFPFKEAWKSPWTVITLKPAESGKTFVRVASLGYGSDPESLNMRKFFERGNKFTLETLQKNFDSKQK